MARYWAPLRDPDTPETRSRSQVNPVVGTARGQWGQRPLFSVPGPDQPPPDEGRMGPEMRPDDVSPTDQRLGSNARTELRKAESFIPVKFSQSFNNVSGTPTDAEITAAFGDVSVGDGYIIRDGGGAGAVILCIRGGGDTWWFHKLTKAV